jgi:hypothetical protein
VFKDKEPRKAKSAKISWGSEFTQKIDYNRRDFCKHW